MTILADEKVVRLLEPSLQRVLVYEPSAAGARLIRDILKGFGARQVYMAQTAGQALETCQQIAPQVIFAEVGAEHQGLEFVRRLRRGSLPCRQAPVIVVTSQATAGVIIAARNAGVHEFLRKPLAARDVLRRLDAALLHSRDWVEAVSYVGPDRRRFNSGAYAGQRKRRADALADSPPERLQQALKIAVSAVAAIESDPAQALRSLQVQAAEIKALAAALPDAKLGAAASRLQTTLAGCSLDRGLSRPAIEAAAADLWPYLKPDPQPARAVA